MRILLSISALLLALSLPLAGCPEADGSADGGDGDGDLDAGGDGDGDGDGDSDAGTTLPECDPATCPGTCQRVPDVDGARSYCVVNEVPPLNPCWADGGSDPNLEGFNHCCSNDECGPSAVCAAGDDTCGGAPPPEGLNTCRVAECLVDDDCDDGYVCAPPGLVSFEHASFCLRADCTTDADCTDRPGGYCALWGGPGVCGLSMVLGCGYPDDECRPGPAGVDDCNDEMMFSVCYPTSDGSGAACTPVPPPPP